MLTRHWRGLDRIDANSAQAHRVLRKFLLHNEQPAAIRVMSALALLVERIDSTENKLRRPSELVKIVNSERQLRKAAIKRDDLENHLAVASAALDAPNCRVEELGPSLFVIEPTEPVSNG